MVVTRAADWPTFQLWWWEDSTDSIQIEFYRLERVFNRFPRSTLIIDMRHSIPFLGGSSRTWKVSQSCIFPIHRWLWNLSSYFFMRIATEYIECFIHFFWDDTPVITEDWIIELESCIIDLGCSKSKNECTQIEFCEVKLKQKNILVILTENTWIKRKYFEGRKWNLRDFILKSLRQKF